MLYSGLHLQPAVVIQGGFNLILSNDQIACDSLVVKNWFAERFQELHPLLQQLHTGGGKLSGEVDISYGAGIAGFIGARLARKMRLPKAGRHHLCVDISHTPSELIWSRRFAGTAPVVSIFQPVGQIGSGHWLEKSGAMTLQLTVDIIGGGWYWRCKRMNVANIELPLSLMPRSEAYKKIEDGRYRFDVRFNYPFIGSLVSYSGLLDAELN